MFLEKAHLFNKPNSKGKILEKDLERSKTN